MDCYQLFADKIQRFKVGSNGQASGLCPFHEDRKPSFSANLNTGLWKCHGCGKSGNAYQFAEWLGLDYTLYQKERSNGNINQSNIESKSRRFNKYLVDNFDDLKKTGKIPNIWTLEAVKDTFTGYDETKDCLVFNHCNLSGKPINIQHHKMKQHGQSESKLFPLNLIQEYDKDSFLVFCEGCKDAVTLLSMGINAITNTTGAGSIPKDLTPLKDFKIIYIVYDNDKSGIEGSQSLANKLKYEFPAMDIRIYFWKDRPDKFDITDYFQDDNTVQAFYKLLLSSETFKISNGNWLKLYRKSLDSEVFQKPDLWRLFTYLLLAAAPTKKHTTWHTGKRSITVLLERGQLISGRNRLSKILNIRPSTLNDRLKCLQNMEMIRIEPDNQYSIVTICNFETYQQ